MWLLIVIFIVLSFGFVILFGAPYVPTHTAQAHKIMEYADLKPGMVFYELGCGDGKMLILAAKTGASVIGVELNPILYFISVIRTARYKNVSVKLASYWKIDVSSADVVYVFLIKDFMPRLNKKLESELKKGARLISYAFEIPGRRPMKNHQAVFMYKY